MRKKTRDVIAQIAITLASISESLLAGDQAERRGIGALLRTKRARRFFRVGGRTAQDYGNAPTRCRTLDLSWLAKDRRLHAARYDDRRRSRRANGDLAATLAAEGQHLPIDVPRASDATIGGVVATNWSGPRRYGHGTIRDYVIGIHAVDGRGVRVQGRRPRREECRRVRFLQAADRFAGNARRHHAIALKVKPQSEQLRRRSLASVLTSRLLENVLNRLPMLETPPVAIDLLSVRLEAGVIEPASDCCPPRRHGDRKRVAGGQRSKRSLRRPVCRGTQHLNGVAVRELWSRQVEFSDRGAGGGR